MGGMVQWVGFSSLSQGLVDFFFSHSVPHIESCITPANRFPFHLQQRPPQNGGALLVP